MAMLYLEYDLNQENFGTGCAHKCALCTAHSSFFLLPPGLFSEASSSQFLVLLQHNLSSTSSLYS